MLSRKASMAASKNTIFENWFSGIVLCLPTLPHSIHQKYFNISDGCCAAVSANIIHNNRCGGLRVAPTTVKVMLDDSFLLVPDCKVRDNCLAQLEARDGGTLVAEGNELCNSKFAQGVTLGPRAGPSQVRKNRIHGNVCNGIEVMNGSFNLTIEENEIYHNGQFGIQAAFSTSTVLRCNNVFENWFWGINVLGKSKAQLFENVVHHNKCGGIRLEVSCEAIARGNKVSDHNGPGILTGEATVSGAKIYGIKIRCEVLPPWKETLK